jgi:hypothetical protein
MYVCLVMLLLLVFLTATNVQPEVSAEGMGA